MSLPQVEEHLTGNTTGAERSYVSHRGSWPWQSKFKRAEPQTRWTKNYRERGMEGSMRRLEHRRGLWELLARQLIYHMSVWKVPEAKERGKLIRMPRTCMDTGCYNTCRGQSNSDQFTRRLQTQFILCYLRCLKERHQRDSSPWGKQLWGSWGTYMTEINGLQLCGSQPRSFYTGSLLQPYLIDPFKSYWGWINEPKIKVEGQRWHSYLRQERT